MADNEALRLFGDRLVAAATRKRSHVMLGLDPHLDLMPSSVTRRYSPSNRESAAAMIAYYCEAIVEAISDVVAFVKPQVAFFERLGPPGISALEHVVKRAHACELLVIVDAKRSDIGSTAAAYAEYYLGAGALGGLDADAVTVNPYLGSDSLGPFVKYAHEGKGVFVLAKTSNPGADELQDREINSVSGKKALYEAVGDLTLSLGEGTLGRSGLAALGLVVGATKVDQARVLRHLFPELPFLVPGYGTQGATAADVTVCFNDNGLGALVSASRSIMFAYKKRQDQHGDASWSEAAREEAIVMRDQLNSALKRVGKLAW